MAKESKGKKALKTTGRALKKAASSVLGAGSQILGAGSKALANPKGRSYQQLVGDAIKVLGVGEVSSLMQGGTLHQIHRKYSQAYNSFRDKEAKAYQGLIVAWSLKPTLEARQQAGLANPKKRNKTIIKAKRIDHLDVSKVHNPRRRKNSDESSRSYTRAMKQRERWIDAELLGRTMAPATRKAPDALKLEEERAKKSQKKKRIERLAKLSIKGLKRPNPRKRIKLRNRYVDIVIKGQAKKTPQGWKVGKKTFAQGRGTVSVSSGYYLDRATGFVYSKRERNATKKRRNVEGFYDPSGVFHPIRSAADYDRTIAGETGKKPRRTKSKKRIAAKRKASATARHRSVVKARKATTTRLASRSLKKSVPLKKRGRKNPSAESIRKKFAGSITGSRDLYFPKSTPTGKLAKLGRLVLIETEKGTIKPVAGTAWLCADERERLHIGSTSPNPLFNGPARSFGKVKKVEYESSKPHLGYRGPIIWFHHMGEKGGVKPTLHADGKGGLVFKGGNYRLTERGIEH